MSPPAPPAKALGALSRGSNTDDATCSHGATVTEQLPETHVHYAQLKCASCGRHIRWLPQPENVERKRLNDFRLAKLAKCDRLTSWERHFVRDVSQRKKVSPRQQAIVDDLAATYLEEAA
jgi:hypothetical protein